MAEKTIEFQTFQNVKVPLEVVAGQLTMDLQPKHARQGTEEDVFMTPTGRRRCPQFWRSWDPQGRERLAESCLERGNREEDGFEKGSKQATPE